MARPVGRRWSRNSRLPSAPVMGDGVTATASSPTRGRGRVTSRDDARVHRRVADDAALADFGAPRLELRLHQRHHVGARRAAAAGAAGRTSRSEMNETSIVDEIERPGARAGRRASARAR